MKVIITKEIDGISVNQVAAMDDMTIIEFLREDMGDLVDGAEWEIVRTDAEKCEVKP